MRDEDGAVARAVAERVCAVPPARRLALVTRLALLVVDDRGGPADQLVGLAQRRRPPRLDE
jgi:hypothetical protein